MASPSYTLDNTENSTILSSLENNSAKYENSKYNKPDFQLSTRIYIFNNGLFTRELQPIDYNKERELFIQCTLYKYNKTVKIPDFQSSNFIQYYKNKHPAIAYNEKSEKTLKKLIQL
jgi:hypothetical protein